MRHALSRAAILPLLLLVAACASPGPSTTAGAGGTAAPGASDAGRQVTAEEVAESLMAALRDSKIGDAWEIVSSGTAERDYNGEVDFMAKMIAAGTPKTWTFDPLGYESDDSGSYIVLEGPVTFEDGDGGHVKIRMQALGLQANPWRVAKFSLEKA